MNPVLNHASIASALVGLAFYPKNMPANDEGEHVGAEEDVAPLLPLGQRFVLGLVVSLLSSFSSGSRSLRRLGQHLRGREQRPLRRQRGQGRRRFETRIPV